MPPSADDKIIEDAVQDFSKGLHSDLPLRHFGEFHDQEELKKMVDLRKDNVFRKVLEQVWTRDKEEMFSLLKKLNDRIIKEVIGEWVTRNREHRVKSVSFLQKWVDMLCDNFNMSLEYQLLLNPGMEIESLKNIVERRKETAINCFESIWKPGNSEIQAERKSKLEKQLKILEEEAFDKHQRNSESKSKDDGNKLLGDVMAILLERSRQLKRYVDKHQGRVSNDILRGMVEEMRDYILTGKGSILRESHEENFNKLIEVTQGEIKFLTEGAKDNMTAEDVVGYAERFDEKIRSCCCENASDKAPEMLQDMTTRVPGPTADPRRYRTMQNLFNEFKEEHGDSLDLEQNEVENSTNESNIEGGDDGNSNDGAAPEPSSGGKRGVRQHPSRRRFKISVKETETGLDDPIMNPGAAGRSDVHEIPHLNCIDDDNIQDDNMMGADIFETPSSSSFGMNKMKGNEDNLYPSRQMRIRSKRAISRTTRRASGTNRTPRTSSEQAEPRSVSNKSKGSKLGRKKEVCCSDDKMIPKHITILKGDNPKYLCTVCKRKFRWKKYLNYHGDFCGSHRKSAVCHECGKRFYGQYQLDAHKRVHTGEKPFRCSKCPERFSRKENLQNHIRCHAKKNAYVCKQCNLKFVSVRSLNEHNLAHAAKFRYPCSYCDKRYDQMFLLRKHVIIHADDHPFKCPNCETSSSRMENLRAHIEQVHCQTKQVAYKLAYDACVAYLVGETKNESYRDIPSHRIDSAILNHVIKKANLRLPSDSDISSGDQSI